MGPGSSENRSSVPQADDRIQGKSAYPLLNPLSSSGNHPFLYVTWGSICSLIMSYAGELDMPAMAGTGAASQFHDFFFLL